MTDEFHAEVLQQMCPTCKVYRGEECQAYTGSPVSPPHVRRWAKVAERHYRTYIKASKGKKEA